MREERPADWPSSFEAARNSARVCPCCLRGKRSSTLHILWKRHRCTAAFAPNVLQQIFAGRAVFRSPFLDPQYPVVPFLVHTHRPDYAVLRRRANSANCCPNP